MAHIFKNREQCDLEVTSKDVELTSLLLTFYLASINQSLLKHIVSM